jgi:hypothetical protein
MFPFCRILRNNRGQVSQGWVVRCLKCWRLMISCCITNYHKFSSLKQHLFIMSVSVGQKAIHGLARFSAQCHTGSNQDLGWGCYLIWDTGDHFQAHSRCWQNLSPGGCMIGIPIFLLAVSMRLSIYSPSESRGIYCLEVSRRVFLWSFIFFYWVYQIMPGLCKRMSLLLNSKSID